jgi:hypothetical protein
MDPNRCYDDFGATVLRLLNDAADDPAVVSLKLTLYRTGENSPVVDALLRASAAGKEVVAFVELKASYDEARNIAWVRQLERAGAQVVYGVVGLKNHAKVALVSRREDGEIRATRMSVRATTTPRRRFYTDLGLLTANAAIADDLGICSPGSPAPRPRPVRPSSDCSWRPTPWPGSPRSYRARGRDMRAPAAAAHPGQTEQARRRRDGPGALRGIGGRRRDRSHRPWPVHAQPGVPGLSDRIRVRGAIGRFLEHARIYHFANGGDDEYFIASADWRSRNLHRRVEVAAPVRTRLPSPPRYHPRAGARRSCGVGLAADGSYHQRVTLPVSDPSRRRRPRWPHAPKTRPYGPDDGSHTTRALVLGAALLGGRVEAQERDTVVTPGKGYAAGGFHRWLFGSHYRDLWTTPCVPVLDLETFAGGLRPTERGGGKQTKSLRFKGADGRQYQFRSLDKDPRHSCPGGAPPHVRRGGASGPDQCRPSCQCAGRESTPRRRACSTRTPSSSSPDSPALGPFRSDFAGLLGTIEERPTDNGPGRGRRQDREHLRAVRSAGEGPGRAGGCAGLPRREAGGSVPRGLGSPCGSRRWARLGDSDSALDPDSARPGPGLLTLRRAAARPRAPVAAAARRLRARLSQHGGAHLERSRGGSTTGDGAGAAGVGFDRHRAPGAPDRRGDRRAVAAPAGRAPAARTPPRSPPRSSAGATTCRRQPTGSTACWPAKSTCLGATRPAASKRATRRTACWI